jgi:glycosyltransferase involved in cell wall biosynthesis
VTEATAGPAAARNKGISSANAEVVALFDSDIMPAPKCLERAMRIMTDQPECQVVVCRIDPLFFSGKMSSIGRAVEWFDAVTNYNPRDWVTDAGAFVTKAMIVRKEVFAECGYFNELCPEAAGEEWARRVLAAGVKVAFCRKAVVRHETVRSIAELRRKKQRHAGGDCILKSLERNEVYGVIDVFRDEWREWRGRVWNAWSNKRIPPRYRAGVLLLSLWSCLWTLSEKLQYRNKAQRVVRRRRQTMDRTVRPSANAGTRGAGLPFRWLGPRAISRRSSNQDVPRRSPSN